MQTQQRISASTSPAPFFLPVQQQTSASSYFSISSSPSVAKQQKRPQQRAQNSTSTTNSYFKTSETAHSHKQKETQLESHSSNRLTALHSSLQQEAEKIRKWKNATELELKNKEKCLSEANCTIGSQRKCLTELQLKNESLQSKLSDEIANQKELRRKIASTREMCTALKNHCLKIDVSIMKGQEDRDHLMLLNQERLLNYQELSEKYQQLEEGQNEWHNKYESTLAVERGKIAEMEDQQRVMSEQLEEASCKISEFEQQSVKDKEHILSLREEIETKLMQCDVISREKSELETALSLKEERLLKSEHEACELKESLDTTKQQLSQYISQLDQTQGILETNERAYSVRISQLESTVSCETEKYKDLLKVKEELESDLARSTTELEGKCQALNRELEGKIQAITQSHEDCQSLEAELTSLKSCRNELQGAKAELKVHVHNLEGEVLALKEDLTQQITEKGEGLKKAETLISDVVSRHESVRGCWLEQEGELKKQLEEKEGEKEAVTRKLNSLRTELETLKVDFETQMKVSSEQSTKQEGCMEDLKTERGSLATDNANLKNEIRLLNENKETLTAQCSKMKQIQSDNQNLKTNLENKTLLSEDLRTKILQLETAVSIKDKEQNLLIEQLRNEVAVSNARENDVKKSHALEVAELKEGMRVQARELTSQLEDSRKGAEETRKELLQEKESCMQKVADLAAALDSYRSEREAAMETKDKVIEDLTDQLQETEESKAESDSKVRACEDEIETLHSEINLKNDELKQLLKSVEAVCYKGSKSAPPVPSTPMRKTPQSKSALTRFKAASKLPDPIAVKPLITDTPKEDKPPYKGQSSICNNEISSTPQVSSNKVSSAANTANSRSQYLPRLSSSCCPPPKPVIPSTPTRLYNYSMTATPQSRAKGSTGPKYSSRPKRMRCESIVGCEEGGNAVHRDNVSYTAQDEDEAVFKKPKAKDASVTIQKASSTTRAKKQTKSTRGKKNSGSSTDMSWFDLDAVYGFGSTDNNY